MEVWKLNLKEIGILEIICELKFLKIGILENYLRTELKKKNLEIGILENCLKIKVFENWNFRKLFENEFFLKKKIKFGN